MQALIAQHVLFPVSEVWNELLRVVDGYRLWGQRVVVVEVVELFWVLEVDLQGALLDLPWVLRVRIDLILRQPLKVSDREGLAHRPPVKVVSV